MRLWICSLPAVPRGQLQEVHFIWIASAAISSQLFCVRHRNTTGPAAGALINFLGFESIFQCWEEQDGKIISSPPLYKS